jgi:hypothetical protein
VRMELSAAMEELEGKQQTPELDCTAQPPVPACPHLNFTTGALPWSRPAS